MANSLRESLTRADESRTLLRSIYTTEADLLPDDKNKTLTVGDATIADAILDRVLQKITALH
jgi:hypothetical protein